jgi:EmrB/QacA subfamily drug resistance transporter
MALPTEKDERKSGFWLVVMAACSGTFVVAYNTTAVMTALPAIKVDLDLDVDTLQWVINLYMLFGAATLAAMGHLGDTFGMTRIFLAGVAVFALGSIAIALTDGAVLLLMGRALQGLAVASIMSASVALINRATPPESRATALGIWAAALALGFASGPLIGGILTDSISWRAIFVLDLIILFIATLLCVCVIRAGFAPAVIEGEKRTDFPGIALLFVALASFLYALTCGPLYGWTSLPTIGLFTLTLVAGAGFMMRELRFSDPLIRLGFFRYRNYAAATTGMILAGFTQIGILFFINSFIQSAEGLNFSASQAGLALLPFTAVMFVVSLVAPHVIPEKTYGIWATISMACLMIGFWLMRDVNHQTPYKEIWWRLTFIGAGVGLNMMLLPRIGLGALPQANTGQGSGVINTCLYAGLAIGTALGAVVVAQIKQHVVGPYIEGVGATLPILHALKITLVHGSQSQVSKALAELPSNESANVQEVMLRAFDHGFSGVMLLMTAAAATGAVLCAAVIRREQADR